MELINLTDNQYGNRFKNDSTSSDTCVASMIEKADEAIYVNISYSNQHSVPLIYDETFHACQGVWIHDETKNIIGM